jgi:NADH-quinone oxidoreductase subunit L
MPEMSWIVQHFWLIPTLPLLAAGLTSLVKQSRRTLAASLAIGSMLLAFFLSCAVFYTTLGAPGEAARHFHNFDWFQLGETTLRLGWVLDPLAACMLVMVTLVGTLIFIYSVGYMAHDENFTRFFCFLSLFAAAMLGLVIANNLLLLFICWELVGLASYLLIGFWYHKPSAAAAAKKAFITTRIGDIGFFLGMLWLYAESGTLLFYDGGNGCMENTVVTALVTRTTILGMGVSTGIALLIFCGAMGKSGQVPLHVWLPDAMEGPTPVSALIHAATMVAAGVFLVARVYPLMEAVPVKLLIGTSTALKTVTWVGVITAVFAALIAVAQTDIKRILAYSTVSQLGYMMMGLGVGGVAVGMFHLLTHAFFKALLFLGAGSVIHGCDDEQDIRRMGGLKKFMPVTFAAYAIGMMALSGVPLFFSGFWSKDEILHSAASWPVSRWPFCLGLIGAFLTAFYMSRQMCYVFFGKNRNSQTEEAVISHSGSKPRQPHESSPLMTVPLIFLAAGAILLGFFGTPAWPWFDAYLTGHHAQFDFSQLFRAETLLIMLLSTFLVVAGLALGWWLYGRKPILTAHEADPLERMQPEVFGWLRGKFYVDELYARSVVQWNSAAARFSNWFDRLIVENLILSITYIALGLAWLNRIIDEYIVNLGFDKSCKELRGAARLLSRFQNGQVQSYLRVIGVALAVLLLFLIWGCHA